MTIVLPNQYQAEHAFRQRRIPYLTQEEAQHADIRALRIGILNIFSQGEEYESAILHPMGHSVMQIEPVWIKLKNRQYGKKDLEHLESEYFTFDDAVGAASLDGLLLTGSPVVGVPFEKLDYWQEISRILGYARKYIPATMGICWGALAMAAFLEIPREDYKRKLFGVYETENLIEDHHIMGAMDDTFWCPQSRHSGVADEVLELEREKGTLNLLAYASGVGYVIAETADQRFLMHFGNPEYKASTIVEQYRQEHQRLGEKAVKPANFDLADPINRWRGHRTALFQEWIRQIHESTSY